MKTISMEVWELDALAHNEKTCKRTPLRLQPTKDASGMWHWKDYQWMDGGLGFPQSGVEDHLFYQPGDIVGVQNSAFRIRIKSVRVEQLWEITDAAAQKEGCRGIFSGSGEVMGSGWDVLPREEYEKQWNRNVFSSFVLRLERQPVGQSHRIRAHWQGRDDGCRWLQILPQCVPAVVPLRRPGLGGQWFHRRCTGSCASLPLLRAVAENFKGVR